MVVHSGEGGGAGEAEGEGEGEGEGESDADRHGEERLRRHPLRRTLARSWHTQAMSTGKRVRVGA